MKLVLAGFKGVGKTTCGKLIADKLNLPFFDTDELLSYRYDMPIKALHEELREEGFREVEANILQELMDQQKVVIALGGSTLTSKRAQEMCVDCGCLVYLHSSPETLIDRLHRANFFESHERVTTFKELYETRHPLYCQLCQYRVDVDERSPEEVAHTILNFYA